MILDAGAGQDHHTAVLQQAFETVRDAGGGTVYFRPGYYYTRQTLEVPSHVVIQGSGSHEAGGCQLVLGRIGFPPVEQNQALLSLRPGVTDVTVRDLELRSISTGVWPRNVSYVDGGVEVDLHLPIETENTAAIRMHGPSSGGAISAVLLHNLTIADFTVGVQATSDSPGPDGRQPALPRATGVNEPEIPGIGRPNDPVVTGLRLRNVAFAGNHVGIHVRSSWASGWDLQNADSVATPRNGASLLVERSQDLKVIELNCAGNWEADGGGSNGTSCIELFEHGQLTVEHNHMEGLARTLWVRDRPGMPPQVSPIVLLGAVMPGARIEAHANIVSIGSMFFQESGALGDAGPPGRTDWETHFVGSGTSSRMRSCNDNFLHALQRHEWTQVNRTQAFLGLATPPSPCDFDTRAFQNVQSTGAMPAIPSLPGHLDVTRLEDPAAPDDEEDDTDAIQFALNQVASLNYAGVVYFPAGRYLINRTLKVSAGTILQGAGAQLVLTTPGIALLQHEIVALTGRFSRGLVVRGLTFGVELKGQADPAGSGTTGLEIVGRARACSTDPEVDAGVCVGFASDYAFEQLSFTGFQRAFHMHPESNALDGTTMQVDSVGLHGLVFQGNAVAMDLQSDRASNWNLSNVAVRGMREGNVGIRLVGPGNIEVRQLRCEGDGWTRTGTSSTCLELNMADGLTVDGLSSQGVGRALYARPPAGYWRGGMILRNSDLTDGVFAEGRVRLVSINNTYSALTFGTFREGDPNAADAGNPSPGANSFIHSCGDIFVRAPNGFDVLPASQKTGCGSSPL